MRCAVGRPGFENCRVQVSGRDDDESQVRERIVQREDRALVATDWDSLPFLGVHAAKVERLVIEKDYAVPELRASAEEIAINIVQKIFEVFNWNEPDANMIRGWQQRLLSKTF